jgi:hypothetical protein
LLYICAPPWLTWPANPWYACAPLLYICAPPWETCVHNFDGACHADAANPRYISEPPRHVCVHHLDTPSQGDTTNPRYISEPPRHVCVHHLDGTSHACVIQRCCKFCSNPAIMAFISGANISPPRAKEVRASISLARVILVSNLLIPESVA